MGVVIALVQQAGPIIPIEILITTLVTPILSAIAALFWLLNNEKNKRIDDRDKIINVQNTRIASLEDTVGQYRDSIIPALQSGQRAMAQLADLYAKQQGRGDG